MANESNLKSSSSTNVDLTIFKSQKQISTDKSHQYENCISIQRLLTCMRYYTKLDIHKNKDNIDIFYNFMEEVYKYQIYDDYYHLIRFHQNELNQIMTELTRCNLDSCNFSNRHFRVNTTMTSSVDNKQEMTYLQSYIEVMDSLHFYIHHLQDSSLRFRNDMNMIQKDEDSKSDNIDNNKYFDEKFERMNKHTQNTRNITNRFSRLSGNKFNISVSDGHKIQNEINANNPGFEDVVQCGNKIIITQNYTPFYSVSVDDENKNIDFDTYLDTLYSNLQNNKVSDNLLQSLYAIIIDDEYCTESLDYDLEMFKTDRISNVAAKLQDSSFVEQLLAAFKTSKGTSL